MRKNRRDELPMARAYLDHLLLGARLVEYTTLVLGHRDRSAHEIFGTPDDLKFRSSMTLFGLADPARPVFAAALARFYGGEADSRTLDILGVERSP